MDIDPEKVKEWNARGGRKGGLAKVPKGIAMLSPERRREIAMKGVEARRKKRNEAKDK